MNTIILRGRLTANPELKTSKGEKGTTTARFSLAVPDRTHRNTEDEFDVDFIRTVAYGSVADAIGQYTFKGSEVLVIGKLHTYTIKDKAKKSINISEVVVERIEFISGYKTSD